MVKSTIAGSPGTGFEPTYNSPVHLRYRGKPGHYRVEYYSSSLGYVQYLWAPYDATRNLVVVAPGGPQVELPLPGGSQAIVGSSGVTDYRRANWQGSQVIDSSPSETASIDASFTPYGEHYAENNDLGSFAGNLSIYPFFLDGYAATWRLYHYDQGRWISPDPAGMSAADPTNPQTWNRYAYLANSPLNSVDPSGLDDLNLGDCVYRAVAFAVDGNVQGSDYYLAYCTAQIQAQQNQVNTGGSGSAGAPSPKTGTPVKQSFNQCMAAHANDFSILGAVNAGTNALFNRQDTYKNNVVLGALGGNSITSLLYGSTADAAGTGVTIAPTIVTAAMGTATSYGRRTSTIMALNIAGKGGLPLALGASSAGTKAALTTAGKRLGLGLDFEVKLGIDAGFALAEAAYCYSQTQ